jgi:hypothetical protein
MNVAEQVKTAPDNIPLRYPSYKSFDQFLDLDRLKSLDDYLTEKIRKHLTTAAPDLFQNEHRLDPTKPHEPGAREVWLTRTKPGTPYNYLDLNRPELWELTEVAEDFSELMDFIETLPFERTGRMLIIYDDSGSEVPAHRDHLATDVCHDFIWFRTNLKKPFYLYNQITNEKMHVESYSAWFDTVNQFHGSDATRGLSFSMRVDGIFSRAFRAQIPNPGSNLAATPALWAATDRQAIVKSSQVRSFLGR